MTTFEWLTLALFYAPAGIVLWFLIGCVISDAITDSRKRGGFVARVRLRLGMT